VDPIVKISVLVVSVLSSLFSLAWSLVAYHRSLRYAYHDKANISFPGSACQFIWHFSSITARVLALSLFASAYPAWIGVVIAAHWIVMSSWVVFQRTKACSNQCEELFFCIVLGAVYVFSFFNAKDEPTRIKYVLYYGFCFAENTALIVLWFISPAREPSRWYWYPGVAAHYLTFFLGLAFMLIYYGCFHPSKPRVALNWPKTRRREADDEPARAPDVELQGGCGDVTDSGPRRPSYSRASSAEASFRHAFRSTRTFKAMKGPER